MKKTLKERLLGLLCEQQEMDNDQKEEKNVIPEEQEETLYNDFSEQDKRVNAIKKMQDILKVIEEYEKTDERIHKNIKEIRRMYDEKASYINQVANITVEADYSQLVLSNNFSNKELRKIARNLYEMKLVQRYITQLQQEEKERKEQEEKLQTEVSEEQPSEEPEEPDATERLKDFNEDLESILEVAEERLKAAANSGTENITSAMTAAKEEITGFKGWCERWMWWLIGSITWAVIATGALLPLIMNR